MVLSDHNPISMTQSIPLSCSKNSIWCLDNSLLTDLDITQKINMRLSHYLQENVTEDSSPTTTWAAHKCVMRGEFISMAAHRKKQRRNYINTLSTRIHALERAHKASLATKSLAELLQAREEFREELSKTLKRKYILTQKLFYEFGNKSGKMLARAIQHKKAQNILMRSNPQSLVYKNKMKIKYITKPTH